MSKDKQKRNLRVNIRSEVVEAANFELQRFLTCWVAYGMGFHGSILKMNTGVGGEAPFIGAMGE